MIESELKILLDPEGMQAVASHPRVAALRLGQPRTESLVSVYHDTADHRLAAAGISLRLRRIEARWVQTVKMKGRSGTGFFAHREDERPAPGGRLLLEGDDPEGALAAVIEAAGGAALAPIFETRVERTSQRLALPGLGEVELALDDGEIRAGEATAPIREAELELVSGSAGAIFAVARQILDRAPFRLGTTNKAARGYRLLHEGAAEPPLAARKAGTFAFGPEVHVEMVARDVLRDCLAQISANIPVVLDTKATGGPHQLRIGLRRLRTALGVFAPSLGATGLAPLEGAAQRLGQVVGRLRDADVLIEEVVAHAAAKGLDPKARQQLEAALGTRREAARAEVRAALSGPQTGTFLLDLIEYVETRGWLEPSDYGQTARLARPIGEVAPKLLRKRYRKVRALGEDIRELEPEELHSLRKALKKLRYTVDMLVGLYPGKRAAEFLSALKELQDSFGSLNDAAMAEAKLAGPEPVAPEDPAVQRAVGFTLGILAAASASQRPAVFARWDDLAETRPFWT